MPRDGSSFDTAPVDVLTRACDAASSPSALDNKQLIMPPKRKSDVDTQGGGQAQAQDAGPARRKKINMVGPRIPYQFFTTTGFGQTDSGGGVDPWETGSYDMALEDAGTVPGLRLLPVASMPTWAGKMLISLSPEDHGRYPRF